MRIQDSNVSMASQRSYRQGSTNTSVSGTNLGNRLSGMNTNQMNDWLDKLIVSGNLDEQYLGSSNYGKNALGIDGEMGYPTPAEMHKLRMGMVDSVLARIRTAMTGGMTTSTYYEEEFTSFSASGQVTTADGKTIDFSMELSMSRTFMQVTKTSLPSLMGAFMDPLMINTDAAISRISDQKFLFDLDCDGNEEWISMPSKGSGFLAVDLNGDGIINDGNELFGTKSGDGFTDLSEYDSDGNGWIDENDEVFSKLKVWYKDENGNDVLMDLKEADIGAIYLGSQATDFSLMGSDFNEHGMIRSTGFFLRESGGAGTIQHVDLRAESQEERALALMQSSFNISVNGSGEMSTSESINLSGATSFSGNGAGSITTSKSENSEKKSSDNDSDAIDRVDKMALQRKLMQARIKKKAEERRKERKEFLEAELERLREHRSEEEARLEALFGERETIAENAAEALEAEEITA